MAALPAKSQNTLVLSGYYGFQNLGDELILSILVNELQAKNITPVVLSANPTWTKTTYPGVMAIGRTNLPAIIKALLQSKGFISGGGGLFQDKTGPMSPLYYGGLILLAAVLGKPVHFWSQGVGPLTSPLGKGFTQLALRACQSISVRDPESQALIQALCGREARYVSDPVWLYTGLSAKPASQTTSQTLCLGLSLRSWPELNEKRLQNLLNTLVLWIKTHPSETLIELKLFSFQANQDDTLLQHVKTLLEQTNCPHKITLVPPSQVVSELPHCTHFIGMRFHSLILALLAGLPVFGLSYDPKVTELLKKLSLPGCLIQALDTLTPEQLETAFQQNIKPDLTTLQQSAQSSFEPIFSKC